MRQKPEIGKSSVVLCSRRTCGREIRSRDDRMVTVSQVSYAHELARLWCEDEDNIEGRIERDFEV